MPRAYRMKKDSKPIARQAGKAKKHDAQKRVTPEKGPGPWPRLGWLALLALWAFATAALLSFDPADPPSHAVAPLNDPVANWCGPVGAAVAHTLLHWLGPGVWLLMAGLGAGLITGLGGARIDQPVIRAAGLVVASVAISAFAALFWPFASSAPEGAGGLLAVAGAGELTARFNAFGSALWVSLALIVGLVLAFDRWLLALGASALQSAPPLARAARAGSAFSARLLGALRLKRAARARANDVDDDESVPERTKRKPQKKRRKRVLEVVAAEGGVAEAEPVDDEVWEDDEEDDEYEYEDADDVYEEDEEEPEEDLPGAPQVFDRETLRAKVAQLPVRFAAANRRVATEQDLRDIQASQTDLEGYQFPTLELLEDPETNYSDKMDSFVREQATALEEALGVYRIEGEVVGIDSGPVVTLYELKLAPGTKVAQLQAIASDLARSLKAVNIRIVPNTQGRDTVGIEVPNAEKEKVRLKELMTHYEDARESRDASKMRLPMFLGKDAHGDPLSEDLTSMPHMLIAGTTGSGKSVCMNTIIMSFLYTKKPNELKLVLIDPKMVELSLFRDIPHLMCPVVTEMSKAAAIIEWAVTKMDERYELLAEAGVRDIATYNALSWEELKERFEPATEAEEARIPRRLPYIVFVIDELADLMMTHKEVEGSIVRIAQKARAVGIHLVLATQRPQANVVTGLIKSNMPGRISFKVASGMDSRIVLDQKGGELLLGQGDMLFLSPRSHKLIRAQGTLVEDRESRKVVRFLRDVAAPSFERQLVQIRHGATAAIDDHVQRSREAAEEDPLFDKAVEIVLETKRGSVSLLQRRLAIGYTRASRLIDLMGLAGIIGDHKGTVAREVVITPEEWEALKSEAAAMAAEADSTSNGAAAGEPLADGERAMPTLTTTEAPPFESASSTPVIAPEMSIEDEDSEAQDVAAPGDSLFEAKPPAQTPEREAMPAAFHQEEEDEDVEDDEEEEGDDEEWEEDDDEEWEDDDEDEEWEDDDEAPEEDEDIEEEDDAEEDDAEEDDVEEEDDEEWEYEDDDEGEWEEDGEEDEDVEEDEIDSAEEPEAPDVSTRDPSRKNSPR